LTLRRPISLTILVILVSVGIIGLSQFPLPASSSTIGVQDCKEPQPPGNPGGGGGGGGGGGYGGGGDGSGPAIGAECASVVEQPTGTATASVTVIQTATYVQTVNNIVTVVSNRPISYTTVSSAAVCPLQTPTDNNTAYLAVIALLLILLGFTLLRRRRQKEPEIKVQFGS